MSAHRRRQALAGWQGSRLTDREKFRKPVLNDISFRGKKQTFYFEIKTFSSTFVHRIFELLFYRAIYWKGRNSKYNETNSVMTKRSRTRGKRRGENKKRRKEKDGPTFVFPFSGPKQVARGRSHTRKKREREGGGNNCVGSVGHWG